MHLTLHNTTLSGLPSNIFYKIGNVRNISIDIESNNKKFNGIPNPNSALYPNQADKILLTSLNLHFSSLSCDCEIGWVEFWQRKKRQFFCSQQEWIDETEVKGQGDNDHEQCDDPFEDDDLRSVQCSNKNGESLLEVLKTDLECGWSSASRLSLNFYIALAVTVGMLGLLV